VKWRLAKRRLIKSRGASPLPGYFESREWTNLSRRSQFREDAADHVAAETGRGPEFKFFFQQILLWDVTS